MRAYRLTKCASLFKHAAGGFRRLADEYVDKGVSGPKDSRPELNRLMADAHKRRFDVVLVWKLDRFGRPLRHRVNALAEFESFGYRVRVRER